MSPKRLAKLVLICGTILVVPNAWSQASSSSYRVTVIDGDGAMNNLESRYAREPVVQVTDSNRRPVSGAYVEFDAPSSGASDQFANGSPHFATTTNADGLAVGSNIFNNGVPGSFLIQIHVSYQGQTIGEAQIHQTNVAGTLSRGTQQSGATQGTGPSAGSPVRIPASVLGVAFGDQFQINGAVTLSNANLLKGMRLEAMDKPVTLYLHDNCEFMIAPHGAATVDAKTVTLETGSVRARRFGNCRILYGGLWITGGPNADGVASLSGGTFEVASVSGNVQVVNSAGDVLSSVSPGNVATFGTNTVASGATVGGPTIPFTQKVLLGTALGTSLAALGVAIDALLQPGSTTPPTSP